MGLLLAAGSLQAAPTGPEAGVDALLAALARPTPTATEFVERRESELLQQPMLLRGRLERPAPDRLLRLVEQPYRERTIIDGERVTIEREGRRDRRFSLRRAPELAALLAGFQAVLDGDRDALDPYYTIELSEPPPDWTITLQPLPGRRRQPLATITLHGQQDRLDCIVVQQSDAPPTPMLLGEAATAGQPDFDRLCAAP